MSTPKPTDDRVQIGLNQPFWVHVSIPEEVVGADPWSVVVAQPDTDLRQDVSTHIQDVDLPKMGGLVQLVAWVQDSLHEHVDVRPLSRPDFDGCFTTSREPLEVLTKGIQSYLVPGPKSPPGSFDTPDQVLLRFTMRRMESN